MDMAEHIEPDVDYAGISGATMHLKESRSKLRKSLSLNNLVSVSQLTPTEEFHINETERPMSSFTYNPKKRWMSKENINRLAQPKTLTSSDNKRFISLAEAVIKFQVSTPSRFHSKSSRKLNKVGTTTTVCTKPNSLKLSTATRARPLTVTAISREERETLELEEAKKFNIRAHSVNKKAMKGPLKTQVEKKPPTAIEPFHLTEIKKKEVEEVNNAPVFKAQPLSKSLYKPFKISEIAQPTTKPQSPNITKVPPKHTLKKQVSEKSHNTENASRLSRTRPIPFSFETRVQELIKKNEEFINQMLEEEKKAREFHARPRPKAILRDRNCSADRVSTVSSSRNSKEGSTEDLDLTFMARPAFHYSTDERLEARRKLEQQRKEKEELFLHVAD